MTDRQPHNLVFYKLENSPGWLPADLFGEIDSAKRFWEKYKKMYIVFFSILIILIGIIISLSSTVLKKCLIGMLMKLFQMENGNSMA